MKNNDLRPAPSTASRHILLLGRNYASLLCMARSLAVGPYTIDVLRLYREKCGLRHRTKSRRPEAYSKFVNSYEVCIAHNDPQEVISALIRYAKKAGEPRLLIATDDFAVRTVDEAYETLSSYFILSNIDHRAGEITRYMDRIAQKDLARQHGFATVRECVVWLDESFRGVPPEVDFPCFTKSKYSSDPVKILSQRCNTAHELLEQLNRYKLKGVKAVLIEPYIEVAAEYSILGASFGGRAVAPSAFKGIIMGKAGQRGVTACGKVLDPESFNALRQNAERIFERSGYEGLFDIDILEDVKGNFYFSEVNMRFGASGFAVQLGDMNLPLAYANAVLLGHPLPLDMQVSNAGQIFVSEKVLFTEYLEGRLSKREFVDALACADLTLIHSTDDPVPYRLYKRYYFLAPIVRPFWAIRHKV